MQIDERGRLALDVAAAVVELAPDDEHDEREQHGVDATDGLQIIADRITRRTQILRRNRLAEHEQDHHRGRGHAADDRDQAKRSAQPVRHYSGSESTPAPSVTVVPASVSDAPTPAASNATCAVLPPASTRSTVLPSTAVTAVAPPSTYATCNHACVPPVAVSSRR